MADEVKIKAENGDADAQFEMGKRYIAGYKYGINHSEAKKWLVMAKRNGCQEKKLDRMIEACEVAMKAENGDKQAQRDIGKYMADGTLGRNYTKGLEWIIGDARAGNVTAQYELGKYYLYQTGLVFYKGGEALKWLWKAAEQNHAGAQYEIGMCYLKGWAVAINFDEAKEWFLKAKRNGCRESNLDIRIQQCNKRQSSDCVIM